MSTGCTRGRTHRSRCLEGALVLLSLVSTVPAAAEPVRVLLQTRVGVVRDENFFRSSRVVESKDLGSVGFTLDLFQARPRTTTNLQYVPSFEQEWAEPHFKAQDHRFYLGVSHQLSQRTRLGVRERLLRSNLANGFSAGELTPLVVAPRTHRFEHSLNVDLDHELSRRTGVVFGLEHQIYDYKTTKLFDTKAYGGSVGYAWRRERGFEMRAIARLLRHDPSNEDPTDIASVGFRFRQPVNRWQEMVFEAGGYDARGPAPAGGDRSRETRNGWYGSALYGWSNGRFAVSSAQLRRDVAPAPGVSVSTVADTAMLNTTLSPTERLRLDLGAQATRYEFLFGTRRVTDAFIGDVRGRWMMRPDVELVAGWSHIYQSSDVPELDNLDYDRFYFGVNFPLFRRGPAQAPDGALPSPIVTN
jgi:hypothetical protein